MFLLLGTSRLSSYKNHRKALFLFLVLCVFFSSVGLSCTKKEKAVIPESSPSFTVPSDRLGWFGTELMPYPIEKQWNETQDENVHLYTRGSSPLLQKENTSRFNEVAASIPQKEIDLLTTFATSYHESFLKNQFASTNYGYNISYFDESLISIPFTFFSNFGGSSPEDLITILNYSLTDDKALKNEDLFSPFPGFLKTISSLCQSDLTDQFTNFESVPPPYAEYLTSIYDYKLLAKGTEAIPQNYEHISLLPEGIIVFFLSGQICKPNAGIWEVFIPYTKITQFVQFKPLSKAFSEISYPDHWSEYADKGSFILHYPSLPNESFLVAPTTNSSQEGAIKIEIPVSFSDPTSKTNFSRATIEVFWNQMIPLTSTNELVQPEKERIDGVEFLRYAYEDAAAGNRYEVVEYIGQCLKIHYKMILTIHSTAIENYAPNTCKPFEKEVVRKMINTVFSTFRFR